MQTPYPQPYPQPLWEKQKQPTKKFLFTRTVDNSVGILSKYILTTRQIENLIRLCTFYSLVVSYKSISYN